MSNKIKKRNKIQTKAALSTASFLLKDVPCHQMVQEEYRETENWGNTEEQKEAMGDERSSTYNKNVYF